MLNHIETIAIAAKAYANAEGNVQKKRAILLDGLVAAGTLVGFNKQEDGKYGPIADACRTAFVAARGTKVVALWNTPTRDLDSKDAKAEKRQLIKDIGSMMSKLNNALDERINGKEDRGPIERKNDNTWFAEWYIAGLKRAESTETFEGDAVELVEWLKDCPINR